MRILLVNPPYLTLTPSRGVGHQVPLGLLMVGGPLLDAGHQVRLLDAECQHLTTAAILRTVRQFNPDLVMTDEPTEGLAPKIVEQVAEYLQELQNRGIAVLLVEQKLAIALEISQRVYVMGHGTIQFEGTPADLKASGDVRREWLEV